MPDVEPATPSQPQQPAPSSQPPAPLQPGPAPLQPGPAPSQPAPPGALSKAGERPPVRLAAFLIGLALALIAGFGLGRVVTDPSGTETAAAAGEHTHPPGTAPHDDSAAGHAHPGGAAPPGAGSAVGGLAISDSSFRLAAESTVFPAGRGRPLRFQIVDAQSLPVTRFTVLHDKPMHLIVARRDLSGYQHLHPTMAPDGTWSVPLTLREPGVWRAYADFTAVTTDGTPAAAVLGVDLTVPGDYRPRALPAPAPSAGAGGFEIRYEGTPRVGSVQPLLFRVTGAGTPAALEPYLGSYGHLVVLREGDMGYVHVHPEAQLAGGAIKFWLTAPAPGRYRMFLDFQVAGAVHTAEFTLAVG